MDSAILLLLVQREIAQRLIAASSPGCADRFCRPAAMRCALFDKHESEPPEASTSTHGLGDVMFISDKASRIRQKEAQNARDNRLEIVKALSIGQITRRDLYKWGLLTVTGAMAWKHGLNPLVKSAYANVPTGTPRSPLFGAQKFSTPLPRLSLQTPFTLTRDPATDNALWPAALGELPSRRLSYHTEFTNIPPGDPTRAQFINPVTGRGPIEGRPPGEVFDLQ
jgi:hypothetical protein